MLRPFQSALCRLSAAPSAPHRGLLLGCLILLLACGTARVTSAAQVPVDNGGAQLSDLLIPGNFAIVGDKEFSNFQFVANNPDNAPMANPSHIHISIPSGTDIGLQFQAGAAVFDNQMSSMFFAYDVTVLDPNMKITGARVTADAASTQGGGLILINEDLRSPMPNPNTTYGANGIIVRADHPEYSQSAFATFPVTPVAQIVHVSETLSLFGKAFNSGNPNAPNIASIGGFTNTFTQAPAVPEAGAGLMAGIGAACVGLFQYGRRRRQRNRVSA